MIGSPQCSHFAIDAAGYWFESKFNVCTLWYFHGILLFNTWVKKDFVFVWITCSWLQIWISSSSLLWYSPSKGTGCMVEGILFFLAKVADTMLLLHCPIHQWRRPAFGTNFRFAQSPCSESTYSQPYCISGELMKISSGDFLLELLPSSMSDFYCHIYQIRIIDHVLNKDDHIKHLKVCLSSCCKTVGTVKSVEISTKLCKLQRKCKYPDILLVFSTKAALRI